MADCKAVNCKYCAPFRMNPQCNDKFITHGYCSCKEHEKRSGISFTANGQVTLARHIMRSPDHLTFRSKFDKFMNRKQQEINNYINIIINKYLSSFSNLNNNTNNFVLSDDIQQQFDIKNEHQNYTTNYYSDDMNEFNDTKVLLPDSVQHHLTKLASYATELLQEPKETSKLSSNNNRNDIYEFHPTFKPKSTSLNMIQIN